MSFRGRVFLVGTAASILIGAAVLFSHQPEPSYHGKSLSLWLKSYCYPSNPTANDLFRRPAPPIAPPAEGLISLSRAEQNRREAAELERRRQEAADAVRHIGTNALPTLLRQIDAVDMPRWTVRLSLVCGKLPQTLPGARLLNWCLFVKPNLEAGLATTGFTLLGSQAAPAVPELTRRMSTRTSRSANLAILALADIGVTGSEPLLAALANTNSPNRLLVARVMETTIRNQDTNRLRAIRCVANCVSDADAGVAAWSALTLGALAVEPEIAVPALTEGLNDPRAPIRCRSAEALSHFGPTASPALGSLRRTELKDPDPTVRAAVAQALAKLETPREN